MSAGAEKIAAERRRQIEQEGFIPAHDDAYEDGQLRKAAGCYIHYGAEYSRPGSGPPPGWPWEAEWWKPKDPVSDLVRAAALLAAEIDRLQRKEARKT